MAMLVFKNGSLCREKIRDSVNASVAETKKKISGNKSEETNSSTAERRCPDVGGDDPWRHFDDLLSASPIGNDGAIGIFFHEEEITPKARGVFRFNERGWSYCHSKSFLK